MAGRPARPWVLGFDPSVLPRLPDRVRAEFAGSRSKGKSKERRFEGGGQQRQNRRCPIRPSQGIVVARSLSRCAVISATYGWEKPRRFVEGIGFFTISNKTLRKHDLLVVDDSD